MLFESVKLSEGRWAAKPGLVNNQQQLSGVLNAFVRTCRYTLSYHGAFKYCSSVTCSAEVLQEYLAVVSLTI